MAPSELLNRALNLSERERGELARQLILSFEDDALDHDADAAWQAEIERRLSALDRGEVTPVDRRASIERIRQQLKKRGLK